VTDVSAFVVTFVYSCTCFLNLSPSIFLLPQAHAGLNYKGFCSEVLFFSCFHRFPNIWSILVCILAQYVCYIGIMLTTILRPLKHKTHQLQCELASIHFEQNLPVRFEVRTWFWFKPVWLCLGGCKFTQIVFLLIHSWTSEPPQFGSPLVRYAIPSPW